MSSLRIGSTCSGYEGLGMAIQGVFGGELAWVADNDPGAAKILAHHYPDIPNLGDITATDWSAVEPVDIFAAGFPCQPVSLAGKGLGEADERWIWPQVVGAVRVLRPGLVVLENVSALVVRGLAGVAADLASIGYVGSWRCLRASDVGACHGRDRLFILAWPAEDADGAAGGERRLAAPGQAEGRRPRPDLGRSGGVQAAADATGDTRRVGYGDDVLPRGGAGRREPAAGGSAPANPEGVGWDQGWPEPARIVRGSHAAVSGGSAPEWAADEFWQRPGTFRDYERAVRRHERVFGRAVPAPVGPGRNGKPRLTPRLPEWMMGLPDGWVTDVPGLSRNDQLHAIGNGVMPQQGAAAIRLLLERAPEAVRALLARTASGIAA